MQHCPARAAQRLAAAVLALCLVLALAIPHAHAAALQETHGIRMLEFTADRRRKLPLLIEFKAQIL